MDKKGLSKNLPNYGDSEFSLFLRKAFIKGAGYGDDALNKPIVGITNTGSGFNPCHGNMPQLIEAAKRGVLMAGGLPIEFPTISIHESFSTPTSMYLRNLMSIDTEEMIRAQPIDSIILLSGCDKTVPAQLMGAVSANIPTIQLVTGSMLTGAYEGTRIGACTDCRHYWGEYRSGKLTDSDIITINSKLVPSVGTCSVMGTASTMACLIEALGIMLPGGASPPAVTSDRIALAELTGRRAVSIIEEKLTPDKILTQKSFENAIRILLAIGGSTNGIIHLAAIAGRLSFNISLEALDEISHEIPVLVDLKPSGQYYMEDFHKAGGLMSVYRELMQFLHLDALTISGKTLGEEIKLAGKGFSQEVIRNFNTPLYPEGSIILLKGNLAPQGAIIKQSAANNELMEYEGKAFVFENSQDMAERIDHPELDVQKNDILVLKNIGPIGAPGMPEAGYIPIPKKLARQGVKDMVRISDGRMSGTAAGTIILHVMPEAAIGGPLALVQTGDRIKISAKNRLIELLVSEQELLERRKNAPPQKNNPALRGYRKLFIEQVTQADKGCDFQFLRPIGPYKTIPNRS